MVLVHFLKEQTRKLQEQRLERERLNAERLAKLQAEGRVEGRAETHAAWESWNRRRLDAEQAGEPFDESPPVLDLQD